MITKDQLAASMLHECDVVRANARALAGLRIAVGVLFLIFGQYKVFGTEFTREGGGFELTIRGFLDQHGTYPIFRPVLEGVVLAHPRFFAYATAYGELAIGLALVLGVLVRVASASGLALMLALLCSANYPGDGAAFWTYFGASLDHSVLALCFAAFLTGRPAHAWSLPSWRAASTREPG